MDQSFLRQVRFSYRYEVGGSKGNRNSVLGVQRLKVQELWGLNKCSWTPYKEPQKVVSTGRGALLIFWQSRDAERAMPAASGLIRAPWAETGRSDEAN